MCLRHRKEKLPAVEYGTRTSCRESAFIDLFHFLEWRIRLCMNMLTTEFGVHVIVYTPEPFGDGVEGLFYWVGNDVFREAFATVFTGEDVGECTEKSSYLCGGRVFRETYEM